MDYGGLKKLKRDMELVRKILFKIEEVFEYAPISTREIQIDGYTDDQIGYHLRILADARLIDIIDANTKQSGMFTCFVRGITWEGHEFLDAVRDEGVWNHTKKALLPIGSASFDVVKSVAVAYIRSRLGL